MKDIEAKQRLLAETERDGLTVRQLQQRVAEVTGKAASDTATKSTKVNGVPRPIKAVADMDPSAVLGEQKLKKMTPAQRRDCRAALVKAKSRVAAMIRLLDKAS